MFLFVAFIFMTGLVTCAAGITRAFVARAIGLAPARCDVGVGPVIARGHWGSTHYRIRLLPVWTRICAEAAGRTRNRWLGYEQAPVAKRLMIDLTRPVFGVFVAFFLMWAYFAAVNFPFDAVEIVHVTPGSPAAKAGLQAGDVIVASADFEIAGAQRFVAAIQTAKEGQLHFQVLRDGETRRMSVAPESRRGQVSIGVSYWMRVGRPQPLGPVGAVAPALAFVEEATRTLLMAPTQLWTTGPTPTTFWTEISVAFVPSGYLGLVAWVLAALAAMLIALINLVPLPTTRLDGSRIVLSLLSAATGRPTGEFVRDEAAGLTVFVAAIGLVVLYQLGAM